MSPVEEEKKQNRWTTALQRRYNPLQQHIPTPTWGQGKRWIKTIQRYPTRSRDKPQQILSVFIVHGFKTSPKTLYHWIGVDKSATVFDSRPVRATKQKMWDESSESTQPPNIKQQNTFIQHTAKISHQWYLSHWPRPLILGTWNFQWRAGGWFHQTPSATHSTETWRTNPWCIPQCVARRRLCCLRWLLKTRGEKQCMQCEKCKKWSCSSTCHFALPSMLRPLGHRSTTTCEPKSSRNTLKVSSIMPVIVLSNIHCKLVWYTGSNSLTSSNTGTCLRIRLNIKVHKGTSNTCRS